MPLTSDARYFPNPTKKNVVSHLRVFETFYFVHIYLRFLFPAFSFANIASIFALGMLKACFIAAPVFRIASAASDTLKSAALIFVMALLYHAFVA